MTQENLKALTGLMAEFDRLPRTRHAPFNTTKTEEEEDMESCISVPVVRGFLQKKFVEKKI